MDGYVSKPLQPDALYAAIEGETAASSAPRTRNAAPAGNVAAPVEPAALDEAVLMEHFGNDPGLLKEIAGIFVANCSTWQAELHSAADAQDATRLQMAAHTVKGAVGHFGDQEAYDAAYRLELIGKGRDLKDVAAACAVLDQALARLQTALRPICDGRDAGF
jgi:HPt (histidine-containing phosphotransfer) domain-containing protein